MKKPEIMAALFAVFLKTDKTIMELGDQDKRLAFEAEIEALAEQIEEKENKIAQQALELSQNKAKIDSIEIQGTAALDLATQKLTESENATAAVQTELNAFGATAEERAAYVAEHISLQEFYNEKKAGVKPKGKDVTGANVDPEGAEKTSASERDAKILELKKQFPSSIGKL